MFDKGPILVRNHSKSFHLESKNELETQKIDCGVTEDVYQNLHLNKNHSIESQSDERNSQRN